MMMSAEQEQVVEVGAAVEDPGCFVGGLAPAWWPVAAGEGAALVSGGQGSSLAGIGESSLSPVSKDPTSVTEHDGDPQRAGPRQVTVRGVGLDDDHVAAPAVQRREDALAGDEV